MHNHGSFHFGYRMRNCAHILFVLIGGMMFGVCDFAHAQQAVLTSSLQTSPISADGLQRWHAEKDRGGPTFSGSPAWHAHMQFIEEELRGRGVIDLDRELIGYSRWFASDDPASADRSLTIDGKAIEVAAYWAYSGSTDEQGVTAPLVHFRKKMPAAELRDRIVVFDVGSPPASMAAAFKAGNEFQTADLVDYDPGFVSDQWFQGNFVTRFGRFDTILKDSGALGGLVIFSMSPGRVRGLYTFPLLNPGVIGVPGLYLDQVAGQEVREAAIAGRTASLKLIAHEESVETYFLSGVLPGQHYGTEADEFVLLVTHSEGPNLSQENGTLGILAIIDHFARLPRAERNRSLLVLFDPQHYMPGRHLVHWYEDHPEIVARIVSSIGVEQLGQKEYAEDGDSYGLSGFAEPTIIFAQDNEVLIDAAVHAVQAADLPRTEVRVPSRGGQGMWAGLGDFAIKYN
ncbi:MAG: hypothetical protein QGH93_08020, partial [Gammaproteobacteria bacterium]|nr:hypothetical protein [Gammaproteobacteria bacterium]